VPAQTQIFDPGIAESEEDETELLLEAVGDAVLGFPGVARCPSGKGSSRRGELA